MRTVIADMLWIAGLICVGSALAQWGIRLALRGYR